MKDKIRYKLVEITVKLMNSKIAKRLMFFVENFLFGLLWTEKFIFYSKIFKIHRALTLTRDELYENVEDRLLKTIKLKSRVENVILNAFKSASESKNTREEFTKYGDDFKVRIKFPRKKDFKEREGNLKVLKPYMGPVEKGVLLVEYNDSFRRMASIFDLKELAKNYRIVLEPSTWGYQSVDILMFMNIGTEVLVQAQREEDYKYIQKIGNNLIPVRIGAGDWINPNSFYPSFQNKKIYDLIMIASWLTLKRHFLLFKSLYRVKNDLKKVVLVGYPLNGRTVKDVICESKKFGVYDMLEIYESVSQKKVNELLSLSKFHIMLSKREGANKAIYESFFANVPVLVSNLNVGVNREHINSYTGKFSDDNDLGENIKYMCYNYHNFKPRKWALENTGCYNSSKKLNEKIKEIAYSKGEVWTQDIFIRKEPSNYIYENINDFNEAQNEFFRLKNYII